MSQVPQKLAGILGEPFNAVEKKTKHRSRFEATYSKTSPNRQRIYFSNWGDWGEGETLMGGKFDWSNYVGQLAINGFVAKFCRHSRTCRSYAHISIIYAEGGENMAVTTTRYKHSLLVIGRR